MRSRNSHKTIPDVCVERLSLYVRELDRLRERGVAFVSSRRLAEALQLRDAQVRRALSYFGQFGTSGRGYEVPRLVGSLRQILGIEGRTWNVGLAGVGNLGSALLAYHGFRARGFVFRVAVDADARKVGRVIQGLTVERAERLTDLVKSHHLHIGMIAVPAPLAQAVCDQFVEGGVRAIVSFAPARLDVPKTVQLRGVDLALELEALAFHLERDRAVAHDGLKHG